MPTGQPWLWARHDRKPSKLGTRRFGQFKKSQQKLKEKEELLAAEFSWDPSKDFKVCCVMCHRHSIS